MAKANTGQANHPDIITWDMDSNELRMLIQMLLGDSKAYERRTFFSQLFINMDKVDKQAVRKDIYEFLKLRKGFWGLE